MKHKEAGFGFARVQLNTLVGGDRLGMAGN